MSTQRFLHKTILIGAATAALAAAGAHAPPAHAATQCSLASGLLEVHMSETGDRAELQVVGGTIITMGNSGFAVPCTGGTPTTTNTDTVLVVDDSDNPDTLSSNDGNTELRLRNPASLAPGKTPEGSGGEIELFANMNGGVDQLTAFSPSSGSNWIAGSAGVDWNGDLQRELLGGPFDGITFDGHVGDDRFSGQGGGNMGAPVTGATFLQAGGAGDDTLRGGSHPNGDVLLGEADDDAIEGFGGNDRLQPGVDEDSVNGGAGSDIVSFSGEGTQGVTVDLSRTDRQETGEGLDSFAGIESMHGTEHSDTLIGNDANNVLNGAGGDDTLDGRGGSDAMLGEAGSDTVAFTEAPRAVIVDLAANSAIEGPGDVDTLQAENIVGSQFADTLTGDALANRIIGGAGADTVTAGPGADRVEVRDGEADSASCGADEDSAIGDQRTLDTIAADCERYDELAPEPRPGPGNPPTPDRSLRFKLTGASSQRLLKQKAVRVRVSCPAEPCTAAASASGKLRRARRGSASRLRLKGARSALGRGGTRTLKLRLSKASLRALRKALAAKQRPTIKVTARARDAAGNRVVRTLRVKAKR